jgi:hypothetical protein
MGGLSAHRSRTPSRFDLDPGVPAFVAGFLLILFLTAILFIEPAFGSPPSSCANTKRNVEGYDTGQSGN